MRRTTDTESARELAGTVIAPEAIYAAADILASASSSTWELDTYARDILRAALPHVAGADSYAAGYLDGVQRMFAVLRYLRERGVVAPSGTCGHETQ